MDEWASHCSFILMKCSIHGGIEFVSFSFLACVKKEKKNDISDNLMIIQLFDQKNVYLKYSTRAQFS